MHRRLLIPLTGAFLAMLVMSLAAGEASAAAVVQPVYVRTIGSGPGAAAGQLRWPRGMAIDETGGVLYVADTLHARIKKFSPSGDLIPDWKATQNGLDELTFPTLQGVAVGEDGAVYAVVLVPAQPGGSHIFKLAPNGRLLRSWGPLGAGAAEVNRPRGIALGPSGDVFVADTNNHRVLMFRDDGALVSEWGGERGTEPGQFNMPWAIAADSRGDVYVTDAAHRIQEFTFSPAVAIGNISVLLQNAHLMAGITQALQAKLQSALAALEDDTAANDGAGAGALQAFINLVEAQRTKHIPADVADELIAAAGVAMSLVGVW